MPTMPKLFTRAIIHLIMQRVQDQEYVYSFYVVLQKFHEIKQSFESSVLDSF